MMTKEKAIEIFKRLKENAPNEMHLETVGTAQELFEMAIQSLSQEGGYCCRTCKHTRINKDGIWCEEPTCQWEQAVTNSEAQEPCDDAISHDFQIGDEVRIIGSDPIYDDCDVGWVIRNASEKVKTMYVMRNDGSAEEEAKAEWYKTGRHNAMLAEVIKALPSVTQKSGKWIDYRDDGFVECPFCGHATNCEDDIDELHYCFYCGAKMVDPQESEVRNE